MNILDQPVITGDWNGDGRTDVARTGFSGIVSRVSSGTGWKDYDSIDGFGISSGYSSTLRFPVLTGEWNGDEQYPDTGQQVVPLQCRNRRTHPALCCFRGAGRTVLIRLHSYGKFCQSIGFICKTAYRHCNPAIKHLP
ncbi:MAG: hypothetical protein JXB88_01315 [Spirochaetales bacterium]|nr:hypothetical protein [Spirochaetales bacterium]